ncbi:MAG: MmcQ/YjbR family DNA-binding protein [Acidimicrobiia bacterium]
MTTGLDYERVLARCLAYPGAWKDEPWGDGVVVTKVDKKIFAFVWDDSVGVKCGDTRDEADIWLSRYPDDVRMMSYIGRHAWNVITVGGAVPDDEILEAIEDSYLIVAGKLAKTRRPEGWDRFSSP